VGLDHLSRIELGEKRCNLDDDLPDAQLFKVKALEDKLV
jgi:hypothetical protein